MFKKNVKPILLTFLLFLFLFLTDFCIVKFGHPKMNDNIFLGQISEPNSLLFSAFSLIVVLMFLAFVKGISTSVKVMIISAVGLNFFERIFFGGVADYLAFFNISLFNLSDILITIGFILVAWQIFNGSRKHPLEP